MKFESYSFAPEIIRAVSECGYESMTPIQKLAIPPIRRGQDVLASAQTGTGKTAAFVLPLLQRFYDKPAVAQPGIARALILAPTRELVAQVAENAKAYSRYLETQTVALFGGVKTTGQANKLRQGAELVVATPGRLLEHLQAGNINLSQVEVLVLDEADRMLDMGFIKDIQKILQATNKERQTLMFSATFSGGVRQLAEQTLRRPKVLAADRQNTTANTVSQVVYPVEQRRKRELLAELIGRKNWHQVLVFSATREDADQLADELNRDGIPTAAVHSEKAHGKRRRSLKEFTEGKIRVLVSTEVAARGLDIPDLDYVVNYDMPFLAEDYVHRIGRTGRAGKSGVAISFVSREEERILADIEKLIGQRLKRIMMPGYEVSNRDVLLKQLQRRRFGKRKPEESSASEQVAAEKSLSGRRVKVRVGGSQQQKKLK
ncbi:DEAD/DEAH box helicase [Shewanella yunxiaonensis]|uniref:DEAD/DEAH box helicase n=1 Tax=Shewanella yunxiaonensis TaxID=2829809 RepID=A0ABX7YQK5_9GAMM|nr:MULTISPECIES: DEAD/DEAH box helicase [Shewanella]MDF0533870.1 DEAD/DEAH box helicase [Shewanella sp. A32]QUN05053.1 DEAD/DEAH box helicase [Shewanella yunxiaonensis]